MGDEPDSKAREAGVKQGRLKSLRIQLARGRNSGEPARHSRQAGWPPNFPLTRGRDQQPRPRPRTAGRLRERQAPSTVEQIQGNGHPPETTTSGA